MEDFSDFCSYLDDYPMFNTGTTVIEVAPEFSWPDGAGSATDILWIAALTDPAVTHVVGEWDMISFGWTEP